MLKRRNTSINGTSHNDDERTSSISREKKVERIEKMKGVERMEKLDI